MSGGPPAERKPITRCGDANARKCSFVFVEWRIWWSGSWWCALMGRNRRVLRWQCTGVSWVCCWMCCWFAARCVDHTDVVWWIPGVLYSERWWISKVVMRCCNSWERKSWKLHSSHSGGGGMLWILGMAMLTCTGSNAGVMLGSFAYCCSGRDLQKTDK